MKVGDIIYRKDIPSLLFRIVDENKEMKAWLVISFQKKGMGKGEGLVFKDDNRWKVFSVNIKRKEEKK